MSNFDDLVKRRRKFKAQYAKGNLAGCSVTLEKLTAIQRKSTSKTPEYLDDLYNLGVVFHEMGQLGRAKKIYKECLELPDDKKLPGRHFDAGINLALINALDGNYTEAKNGIMDCIYICDDPDSLEILSCRYNLAVIYYLAGEYGYSIEQFHQLTSKSSTEEIMKSDCFMYIGYCHEKMGNVESAIKYFNKAYLVMSQAIGPDNDETLSIAYYTAQYCAFNKKFDKALKHYMRAAKTVKKIATESSAYYTDICNRIADMYALVAELDKSLFYRLKALKIMKKQLGEEHIYYANNLKNVALIYRDKGMTKEAEQYFKHSVSIKEKILGSSNMDYIRDVLQLSRFYIEHYEYDNAVKILSAATKTIKKEGGMDEISTELDGICKLLVEKKKTLSRKTSDVMSQLKKVESRMIMSNHPWI